MCCAQYMKYVKPFEFRNDGAPCSCIGRYSLNPAMVSLGRSVDHNPLGMIRITHNSPKFFAWNSFLTSSITSSYHMSMICPVGINAKLLLTSIKL